VRVEWSDFARDDLADIVAWISRDSPFYGQIFGERVVLATRCLRQFPKSGRTIPEADDEALREVIVQGYRVMYRLEEKCVLILAVMHGSRDLSNTGNQPWRTH
jgi:plasmid stabilization system protein ParE